MRMQKWRFVCTVQSATWHVGGAILGRFKYYQTDKSVFINRLALFQHVHFDFFQLWMGTLISIIQFVAWPCYPSSAFCCMSLAGAGVILPNQIKWWNSVSLSDPIWSHVVSHFDLPVSKFLFHHFLLAALLSLTVWGICRLAPNPWLEKVVKELCSLRCPDSVLHQRQFQGKDSFNTASRDFVHLIQADSSQRHLKLSYE